MGQNLVWGFHITKIHFLFWALIYFSTHQNHELFQNVYAFFFFFEFSIRNFSLSRKTFCLGDNPKLHCLSVTNFSLSCLLYIVCGTRSFVLGYFFGFSVCTADFHTRYHCGCCTVWHSCCLVVIVIFLSVCSYSGELVCFIMWYLRSGSSG